VSTATNPALSVTLNMVVFFCKNWPRHLRCFVATWKIRGTRNFLRRIRNAMDGTVGYTQKVQLKICFALMGNLRTDHSF